MITNNPFDSKVVKDMESFLKEDHKPDNTITSIIHSINEANTGYSASRESEGKLIVRMPFNEEIDNFLDKMCESWGVGGELNTKFLEESKMSIDSKRKVSHLSLIEQRRNKNYRGFYEITLKPEEK